MFLNPRKRLEPHLVDALDVVRVEWAAVKGRWWLSKNLSTQGRHYLQIGSGDDRIEGFLNTCFFLNRNADAWLDARFPFRFPDDTWRGIYAHHIVEHVSYQDSWHLFRECRRTLRPGGVFRMIVPDLEVFIRHYANADPRVRQEIFELLPKLHMRDEIQTPLEMMDHMFRGTKFNHHWSAWDWETAEKRLREAGFSEVIRQSMNVSHDPRLAGHDKAHWAKFSLYVEAVK